MTSTDWPFNPNYLVDLPPTQIKSAVERCKKKNIVDLSAPSAETQNIIQAVFNSYQAKKSRARKASALARSKATAEEPTIDDVAVEPEAEPEAGICEVVAEAEAAPPTPAEPEPPAAAPPTKAAKRADNVAPEAVPKKPVEAPAPAPAPKRAAAAEAPARRRGGLVGMVASIALP